MKNIVLLYLALFLLVTPVFADPPKINKPAGVAVTELAAPTGWLGIQTESDDFNIIKDIAQDSPAMKSHMILSGDVIRRVNGQNTDTQEVMWGELYKTGESARVVLEMMRGEQPYIIPLYAEKRPGQVRWDFY